MEDGSTFSEPSPSWDLFQALETETGRDSGFGMEKVPVNLPTTWFRNASLVGFIEGISIKINWPLCYLAPQTRFVSLYSGHDPQINFCLGSKLSVCHWIKDLNGGFVYWASKLAPFDPFFYAGFEYTAIFEGNNDSAKVSFFILMV